MDEQDSMDGERVPAARVVPVVPSLGVVVHRDGHRVPVPDGVPVRPGRVVLSPLVCSPVPPFV